MKPFILFLTILLGICVVGCNNRAVPKPNAYLNLSYPKAVYHTSKKMLPYRFEYSNQAVLSVQKNYWSDLHYPVLRADLQMTYQKVDNNLTQLISDAEKLTYKHTLKADNIEMYPYEDAEKKIYARLFEISGDAASPIQFQVTDSLKHFLSGSLYFNARPNYDSILPAISFVKKDIQHLIESLKWKD